MNDNLEGNLFVLVSWCKNWMRIKNEVELFPPFIFDYLKKHFRFRIPKVSFHLIHDTSLA